MPCPGALQAAVRSLDDLVDPESSALTRRILEAEAFLQQPMSKQQEQHMATRGAGVQSKSHALPSPDNLQSRFGLTAHLLYINWSLKEHMKMLHVYDISTRMSQSLMEALLVAISVMGRNVKSGAMWTASSNFSMPDYSVLFEGR